MGEAYGTGYAIFFNRPWGSPLGLFESFLDILELVSPSLTHSLLRDCILVSVRAS